MEAWPRLLILATNRTLHAIDAHMIHLRETTAGCNFTNPFNPNRNRTPVRQEDKSALIFKRNCRESTIYGIVLLVNQLPRFQEELIPPLRICSSLASLFSWLWARRFSIKQSRWLNIGVNGIRVVDSSLRLHGRHFTFCEEIFDYYSLGIIPPELIYGYCWDNKSCVDLHMS